MKNVLYNSTKGFLKNHKKLSFVLSHGGLHIAVLSFLILVLGTLVFFYWKSQPEYRVSECKVELLDAKRTEYHELKRLRLFIKNENGVDRINVSAQYTPQRSLSAYLTNDADTINFPSGRVKWHWYNSKATNANSDLEDNDQREMIMNKNGFDIIFPNYRSFAESYLQTSGSILSPKDSPYIDCLLKLDFGEFNLNDSINDDSVIELNLGDNEDEIIVFNTIYPTPTEIGINRIKYTGKEAVERVLENKGIYIDAKNSVKAKQYDNLLLILSILGGTIIAFALDIIITLIYKWRRL